MRNAKRTAEADHYHPVTFLETRESLCPLVAEFLGEGFISHQPALIIATPEHCAGIIAELRARNLDVDGRQARGDLLLLDAADTLAEFMVDGMPNTDRFEASGNRAIERVCRGRKDCAIRAYGETVYVLWKAGQDLAAINLEMLWNKLAMTHNLSLLCG